MLWTQERLEGKEGWTGRLHGRVMGDESEEKERLEGSRSVGGNRPREGEENVGVRRD